MVRVNGLGVLQNIMESMQAEGKEKGAGPCRTGALIRSPSGGSEQGPGRQQPQAAATGTGNRTLDAVVELELGWVWSITNQ